MLIGRKRELLVAVMCFTALVCGCGGRRNVPVTDEGMTRQSDNVKAYVTIEEEAVPLAATLQETDKDNEAPKPTGSDELLAETEAAPTEAAPTEAPEETAGQQPEPTREVEVSLQEEEVQIEVVVETEEEPQPKEPVAETFHASTFAADVQQAVNDARASAGLVGLSTTPELSAAASQRAAEIAGSFSHTRPGGADYSTAVTEAGGSFGSIGENLFRGTESVTAIQNAWNGSPIHLENILNSDFTHMGVGVAETPGGVYVVQIFTD